MATTDTLSLSVSSGARLAACSAKYALAGAIRHRRPPRGVIMGKATHAFIAAWRTNGGAIGPAIAAFDAVALPPETATSSELAAFALARARSLAACLAYPVAHPDPLELTWRSEVELTGDGYHGIVDAIGDLFAVETKTVDSRYVPDRAELTLDPQLLFYSHLVQLALALPTPAPVLYDMIVTSQHRIRNGESIAEFSDRVTTEYREDAESPVPKYYRRELITPDSVTVDAYLAQHRALLARTDDPPRRNFHSCRTRYGVCEFHPICSSGGLVRRTDFDTIPADDSHRSAAGTRWLARAVPLGQDFILPMETP